MAAATQRINVIPSSANPKAWTLGWTGPKNVVIKVLKNEQQIEIYNGATASPPGNDSDSFPLDWDDVALSVALPATDSIWYRIVQGHQSTIAVISQDA